MVAASRSIKFMDSDRSLTKQHWYIYWWNFLTIRWCKLTVSKTYLGKSNPSLVFRNWWLLFTFVFQAIFPVKPKKTKPINFHVPSIQNVSKRNRWVILVFAVSLDTEFPLVSSVGTYLALNLNGAGLTRG